MEAFITDNGASDFGFLWVRVLQQEMVQGTHPKAVKWKRLSHFTVFC